LVPSIHIAATTKRKTKFGDDGRLRVDTHAAARKSFGFGAKNNYVADFPPNKSD
jgi:hypothetical protein